MTTSTTVALDDSELDDNARKVKRLFEERNVGACIALLLVAPQLTRYGISVSMGTKVSDVIALGKDIAFLVGYDNVTVRMPTNGKALLTVDVPRIKRDYLTRDDVPMSPDAPALAYTVGRTIAGETLTADLATDVHLLVAGITGSGKSVFLTNLLLDLLTRNSPDALRLVLIDPKMTGFTAFDSVPHLISPIITETIDAVEMLYAVRTTMEAYTDKFAKHNKAFPAQAVKDIGQYNALGLDQVPYTVVVVDELADLLASHKKEIAPLLVTLATKGRAAGIVLVLGTQKPTADLVPSALKSSLPSSIAFFVRSQSDSRVALDQGGAQNLFGDGDGLYLGYGAAHPVRFQAAYVSNADTLELVSTVMPAPVLHAAPKPVWPTEPVPEFVVAADSTVPVYSHITYTVSGVGKAEVISYRDRGDNKRLLNVPLPWTTTVRVTDPEDYALEATGKGIELFVEHNGQLITTPIAAQNTSIPVCA